MLFSPLRGETASRLPPNNHLPLLRPGRRICRVRRRLSRCCSCTADLSRRGLGTPQRHGSIVVRLRVAEAAAAITFLGDDRAGAFAGVETAATGCAIGVRGADAGYELGACWGGKGDGLGEGNWKRIRGGGCEEFGWWELIEVLRGSLGIVGAE